MQEDRLNRVDVTKVGETISPEGNKLALLKSSDLQDGDIVAITQLPNDIEGLIVNVVNSDG